jgi:uncharacterized protein YjbI with pentapeptide repeats
MNDQEEYDWAGAIISVASCETNKLADLAAAADLDPLAGDLSDVDLSGLDLKGQDFRGWDLRNAKLKGARLEGVELRDAILDVSQLIEATDWEKATLDDNVRTAAIELARFSTRISDLNFTTRTDRCIATLGVTSVGKLVQFTEAELLRTDGFGRKSLNEVKEVLAHIGLHLGMEWRAPMGEFHT